MLGGFLDAVMELPKMMHAEEMQDDQQTFNHQQAEINRNFSAHQAAAQRDWTERMSGTQVQRTAADMSKAGINPIMAVRQAGSTGGGAAASGSMAASGSGQSGMGQTKFTAAALNDAMEENYRMDTRKKDAERNLSSQLYNESQERADLINQQTHTERMSTERERFMAEQARSTAKGLENEEAIDNTTYGKIMRYIDRLRGGSSAWKNFQSR